ncbi:SDR family oxidoreductase, partial [Rudaea sp.]|uniref:SDR family NAD(P)-dependent oxidoreductase n=1 Tax=Rudaea sp. TaxID=2136325 RepID=UPI002ED24693
ALVTGASAGIGAEFARQLAASGHALVLTARRADRLAALADELRTAYGVQVDCIAADLADPHTPAALCDELSRRGLAIDVLINNAGYDVPGSLTSQPWQVHADFIQVLMTAPVELAYRLLPGMRERDYGRIVNVASLAGHVPAPAGHTLYAASKAYLIKFSQALALENRGRNVHVCALCPGFTYSEFHDVTGSRALVSQMPKWLWMQADRVVREGLAAVERGDAVYIPGRVNRTIKGLIKLLPDSVGLRMAAREGRKFRVADDASPST